MKKVRIAVLGLIVIGAIALIMIFANRMRSLITNNQYNIGTPIDSLNGVFVYYNGDVSNVSGLHKTPDGYNLGLRYQCVEFVKRYYYEYLNQKIPDAPGHAKDFFDPSIADGNMNTQRNLIQYTNTSTSKPSVDDIIIYNATAENKYGHVAIISKVSNDEIEIIQQNSGPMGSSRNTHPLVFEDGRWTINDDLALGWLRISE